MATPTRWACRHRSTVRPYPRDHRESAQHTSGATVGVPGVSRASALPGAALGQPMWGDRVEGAFRARRHPGDRRRSVTGPRRRPGPAAAGRSV